MNIVWFKRDLRVNDHEVLAHAAARGPVAPLFIVEPKLWHQRDMSGRHWAFVRESLIDLRQQLAEIGQPLIVRVGEAVDVFDQLHRTHAISNIYSHEETGNGWTYNRDKTVASWCRMHAIPWHQTQQHGTQRRLKSRNGWAKAWDAKMAQKIAPTPQLTPLNGIDPGPIPSAQDLNLNPDPCPQRQKGGRSHADQYLNTFLQSRGQFYRSEMSNPLKGATACSRLSPYLAWGVISMREVAQATRQKQRNIKLAAENSTHWRGSLSSFSGRLHWHCHFIQKLEDEPRLEFENLHKAYDDVRPRTPDAALLSAWQKGETGLPFVDACMRSLNATGWLNFRMRAMVTAVASYHLWLDWRQPGEHLARQFTDYEPGIHWPQIQMQSGTTGINAVRIYNPVKQGYDQDPDGNFVRQWVPELAEIEDGFIQEPWKAKNAGAVLGKSYPHPIIDHLESAKQARQKIWAVRKGSDFKQAANMIVDKHGSRKSGVSNPLRKKARKSKPAPNDTQLSFDLGGST